MTGRDPHGLGRVTETLKTRLDMFKVEQNVHCMLQKQTTLWEHQAPKLFVCTCKNVANCSKNFHFLYHMRVAPRHPKKKSLWDLDTLGIHDVILKGVTWSVFFL